MAVSIEHKSQRSPQFLDLRRLHQFVTAVESPNLRVAATELFVTQQGLSSSLRQLEADLGVELFSRSGRHLRPSEAGRELYRRAPALLAVGQQTIAAIHRAIERAPRPFVIGHTPAVAGEEVFDLVEPTLAGMGSQSFKFVQVSPENIRQRLLDGTIDVAIRRAIGHSLDLATTVVAHHTLRLAVSVRHELAGASAVSIAELAGYPIVMWGPERHSSYTDYLISLCHREGLRPDLVINPIEGASPSTAVAASDTACTFVTSQSGTALGGRVQVIDFTEPHLVPMQAVWLPHTVSPVRDLLLTGAPTSPTTRNGTARCPREIHNRCL
ncbi:LysR family transcriptional regulator [Gordonia sp. DT30]|uniref:LysR family transcriptional regulator n=1 Tax=unclassified Gordonia (in: high G+C Gram-positive bacteria) TaxID=2657482 RepID=UPI003CF660E4